VSERVETELRNELREVFAGSVSPQAVTTYGEMCIVGVLSSVFASIAETGADGALVELARGDPERAAALQSISMAMRTVGSFVAGLLSTWVITFASPRTLISISGSFGLAAAVCGLFVKEYSNNNKKDASNETDRASHHAKASRICCSPLRQLPSEVFSMLPAAVFLMVYNAVPGAAAYESYIFTAFPDVTQFELSVRTFLGQAGSLLGVLLYWRLFVKTGIRTSLMVTTTLAAFANLTRLVFTTSAVTHLPAAYVSILLGADCLVTNMISRLAFMPLLTMAARYAPRGREATAFAALTTCLDLGDEVGQLTTSALSKALAVGAPPLRSWRHLPLLLLLASLGKVISQYDLLRFEHWMQTLPE
jgi:MFS family permease